MLDHFKSKLPIITVACIATMITISFYGHILWSPNSYLFSDKGDGLKNYYTYAYHIKNDSSFTNFSGMNYPYGENYLYTDCHPILANTIKSVSPSLDHYAIGILNTLMILSIFFSFIIVYNLLVKLKLDQWQGILFSLGIVLLSPQLFRMNCHLALSYSAAIPLSWLLTLNYQDNPNYKCLVFLFVNNLFWLFIHAYLGMIIFAFITIIVIVDFLQDKARKMNIKKHLYIFSATLLPVIIMFFYAILTDYHTERTTNPSGFLEYNAQLDDILVPHYYPFRPIIDYIMDGNVKLQWEARGYIGLINSLLFITIVILLITSLFKKSVKKVLRKVFDNKKLNTSLIAACIVLLFAFGIPFIFVPSLLDWFPAFKQFRATGRFVWPFYFVFTAFSAYTFQKIVTSTFRNKGIILGYGLLLFVTGLSIVEGCYYHKNILEKISNMKNLLNHDKLPEPYKSALKGIDQSKFQAIISFPYYYFGSETYYRPGSPESFRNTMVISYHTALPTFCTNLTRTSVEESKRIVQLLTPNYYQKKIKQDIKSRKPFLIIKTGNDFTKNEKAIIDKGNLIYRGIEFELLEITYNDLFSDDRKVVLLDYKDRQNQLFSSNSFQVDQLNSTFYYNGFEEFNTDSNYRGQGSFSGMKKGENVIAQIQPNTLKSDQKYDLSMWMYNGEPDALNLWFRVLITEVDENNNEKSKITIFPDKAEVIDGNWSLIEATFVVNSNRNKLIIKSIGKEDSKASLHVDDILIIEDGLNIYKYDSTNKSLFFNNHRIETP